MNTFKKLLMTFSVFLVAVECHSQDSVVTICALQANDNGRAYLSPCDGWTSINNCPSSGPWVEWDLSSISGKAMYSTALAAFTAGHYVTLRMSGSSCGSYDVTHMIRMTKVNNQ